MASTVTRFCSSRAPLGCCGTSWMCSRQICVMVSTQYAAKYLRNVFSTLLNRFHEEWSQFGRSNLVTCLLRCFHSCLNFTKLWTKNNSKNEESPYWSLSFKCHCWLLFSCSSFLFFESLKCLWILHCWLHKRRLFKTSQIWLFFPFTFHIINKVIHQKSPSNLQWKS